MSDIKTLAKDLIATETHDVPNTLNVLVPSVLPESRLPLDQVRLESYVRLRALPDDLRRIVGTLIESESIAEKIAVVAPGLDRAHPSYYPSGIVELQWKLDDGSVFGLILSSYSAKLVDSEAGIQLEKNIKIAWRFHGPRQRPSSGEFKDLPEALDFMGKSFVTR